MDVIFGFCVLKLPRNSYNILGTKKKNFFVGPCNNVLFSGLINYHLFVWGTLQSYNAYNLKTTKVFNISLSHVYCRICLQMNWREKSFVDAEPDFDVLRGRYVYMSVNVLLEKWYLFGEHIKRTPGKMVSVRWTDISS